MQELKSKLENIGYKLYDKSLRADKNGNMIFVAKNSAQQKAVGTTNINLPGFEKVFDIDNGDKVFLGDLTWDAYTELAKFISIKPSVCNKKASFGTGDRMGMVTAAHLKADCEYPVFAVVAQQSPRELERTNRTFKSVLLDAVVGVLESGYSEPFGADADHIKDEARFIEGVDAGFSMFTIDVSEELVDAEDLSESDFTNKVNELSQTSKLIIKDYSGYVFGLSDGSSYMFTKSEMTKSAIIYEKSMKLAEKFNGIAKSKLDSFDLEVSIDEGGRDTTPGDHLFVAEYLHRNGIDFKSLAPRFPGEFQKAVDYMGDYDALKKSFTIHGDLAKKMQGYRLSLHSGSDKFSVYKMFAEATQGNFHIKTSGTSWLQAVKLVAHTDSKLFAEIYNICLDKLPESKKAYHVYITPEHFPSNLPDNLPKFYNKPHLQQLFHISYGALLDAKKDEIVSVLKANEEKHYSFVAEHIEKHLKLAF